MTPSTLLFELIQTLTKAEKRGFKLMCSSHGDVGNKNFIRLFDIIEKMEKYDEHQVKTIFKKERFILQLTSTKNYLYNLILRSLNQSSENKSEEQLLRIKIQIIPTLYQKKLYSHILPIIHRIKKQAIENELFIIWFEALSWEERLLNRFALEQSSSARFNELNQEKNSVLRKIQNHSLYQNLGAQIFGLIQEGRYSQSSKFNTDEKTLIGTILQTPPLSLRATCDMHYSKGILFFYKQDFEKSHLEFKKLLEILDAYAFLKNDRSNYNYLYAAQNCLATALHLSLYNDFVKNLTAKLKEEYKNDPTNYLVILRIELAVLIKTSFYDRAVLLIEENQKTIKNIDEQEHFILADFLFGAVQAYFWKENYKQTIKWINKVTTYKQNIIPIDLYILTCIIEIIVHLELNNHDLAISYLGTLRRKLEKGSPDFIVEKIIIKYLSNYVQLSNDKKQIQLLKKLRLELNQPERKVELLNFQNNFNFLHWLEKKIADNP